MNPMRTILLLLLLSAVPARADEDVGSVLKLPLGCDLVYEGKAEHRDARTTSSIPFELRVIVLRTNADGTASVALLCRQREGTCSSDGVARSFPPRSGFRVENLAKDWTLAPLPPGMLPAIPAGPQALAAIGALPIPPAGVATAAGAVSRAGEVVLPAGLRFGVARDWKAEIADGWVVLTAGAQGLPLAHAMIPEMRLAEYGERYVIDPASGVVRSCSARWRVDMGGESPREDRFAFDLALVSAGQLDAAAIAAFEQDRKAYEEACRAIWSTEDLDASAKAAGELSARFDASGSLLADEARELVEGVAARRADGAKEEEALRLIGKSASEIVGDLLGKDLKGNEVRLSLLRGKVVVLNFYASWCGPCNQEIPCLKELLEKHAADGLVVVGLNKEKDHEKEIAHARKRGIGWPVVLGSDEVNGTLRVTAFPTNFFLDREGKIRGRAVGFESREKLAQAVEDLLAAK